jgi:predicted nucleic acid-binding protein
MDIQYAVRRKQVHDARMAAFAWAHGIENLLTLNFSDFSRFQEIRPLLPTAV